MAPPSCTTVEGLAPRDQASGSTTLRFLVPPNPRPDLMTPAEVAAVLRVRVQYVYRLIHDGRLEATRPFGHYLRVDRAVLDQAIEAGRLEAWRYD